jgi:Ca-activated chloride channel family protein
MISFGNIKYAVYPITIAVLSIGLFVFYIIWKRRVIGGLSALGRSSVLVRGSSAISRTRHILVIAGIILFTITVLRPQWGERAREVQNEGTDVLIALDVSPSMLARDVGTSRLDRAKDAIRWIADSLKGDRIGLILFSGDAFLQCPLTNDYGAFAMFLDSAGPSAIRLQGTDIGRALSEAKRIFEKKRLTTRMLILISDGEDHEGSAEHWASQFRDMDVSVYCLGVGRGSGEIIPSSNDGETSATYIRGRDGNLIKTKINPALLKKLAGLTRGRYTDISDNYSGLRYILNIIEEQQKSDFGTRIVKEPKEQYQIFALLLIIVLSIELMLPERKCRL